MLSPRAHLEKGKWCLTSFPTKGSSLSRRGNWSAGKEGNGVAFLPHRSVTKALSWWLSGGPLSKPGAVLTLKVLLEQARRGLQTCWLSRRMLSEADHVRLQASLSGIGLVEDLWSGFGRAVLVGSQLRLDSKLRRRSVGVS